MKLKLMPILLGAIALAGSFASVLPLAANAQTNSSNQQIIAQAQSQQRQQRKDKFAGLNLTQAQQDEIAKIRKETKAQLKSVITEEQLAKLKAARQNNQDRRAARTAINLSDAQKAKLKEINQSSKARIRAVLNEQQRQQFDQNMRQKRQQRNSN